MGIFAEGGKTTGRKCCEEKGESDGKEKRRERIMGKERKNEIEEIERNRKRGGNKEKERLKRKKEGK